MILFFFVWAVVTGKNSHYRNSISSFEDWEKTHGYGIVGESSSDSDNDDSSRYDDSYEGKSLISMSFVQTFFCYSRSKYEHACTLLSCHFKLKVKDFFGQLSLK